MVPKPNAECFEVREKFYTFKMNSFWQLLYYHDHSKSGVWNYVDEARRSYEADKYSVLYSINPKYKRNGEYEFLLEYPELTGFNQWCQTSNPLEENETDEDGSRNAAGYREISISWRGEKCGGLVRSSSSALTLLDGTTYHGNTWYSVGRTESTNGGIPGPNGIIIQKTQLWIKVDNPYSHLCSLKSTRSSFNINLFLILVIIHTNK